MGPTFDSLIVIGQAPKRGGRPDLPLYPWPPRSTGGKLKRMMGLTAREYISLERRNLFYRLPAMPGRKSGDVFPQKGDAFPLAEAKARAKEMVHELWGRRVLFIGIGVARAFGHKITDDEPTCKWNGYKPYKWACVPHLSGLNRWWNDADNKRRGGRFLSVLGRCLRRNSAPKPFQKTEQNQ